MDFPWNFYWTSSPVPHSFNNRLNHVSSRVEGLCRNWVDSCRAGSTPRKSFGNDVFVLNALIGMYAKCGDIVKARRVFYNIACKDTVSWNSMLTGYIRHGLLFEALQVFRGMIQEGFEPDPFAIYTILFSFWSLRITAQIHGWVLRRGMKWNLSVVNALISVYSGMGKLDGASWLFQRMPEWDMVSWKGVDIVLKHSTSIRHGIQSSPIIIKTQKL